MISTQILNNDNDQQQRKTKNPENEENNGIVSAWANEPAKIMEN